MGPEFIIAGRYVLESHRDRRIGRGGMGEVFLGHDRETNVPVAVKALRSDRILQAEGGGLLFERFKREGEILRELAHPNIVGMLAVDEVDGRQFLVMEYVSGGSLRDRLSSSDPLPLVEVIAISLEIADALSRVHHLGIVHRDIKPDNILLMDDGTPRLTDFGVAHLAAGSRVTGDGAVLGTLAYLSPEACSGLPADARSDIWSFGVVLFEMLVGRVPFMGETAAMTVASITSSATPLIERVGERIPAALVGLVERMLVKNRELREGSARKIAAELESILAAVKRQAPDAADIEHVERAVARVRTGTLASSEEFAPTPAVQPEVPVSSERRTELLLIEKVRRHWITGVLQQGSPERARLRLLAQRCDEKVERPWAHLDVDEGPRPPLDTGGGLVGLFEATDRALLILGEAGGGKSTLLLGLARTLLDRAERSPREPLPVVLSLSSWPSHGGKLSDWIVDELVVKYQLPRRLGRSWLESDRLLLVLDDFTRGHRGRDCVAAINHFREQHGLAGIVICGRTGDYGTPGQRLQLGGAIELLRPSEAELERTLRSVEPELVETLEQDTELRELARSPLMLTLLRAIFADHRDADPTGHSSHTSTTGRGLRRDSGDDRSPRERLFASFVRRALRRTPPDVDPELVRARLTELAAGMSANEQRVFLIEQLQPSWLRSRAARWVYLALTRLFSVLMISSSLWLVHELLARFGVTRPLSRAPTGGARLLGLTNTLGELAALALIGLAASPSLMLVDGLVYERRAARGPPVVTRDFDLKLLALRLTVLFAVLAGLFKLFDSWIGAISAVSIILILNIFMLVQRGSPGFASEIEPVEALGWSWARATTWGVLAIPLNLGPALFLWAIDYTIETVSFVLVTGVLFVFVCAGLQHRQLDIRSKPNLGTWLSMRNAAIASALVAGAQLPLYYLWWRDWATVTLGMATAALVTALSFGLLAVYQHGVLRLLLAGAGQLPLRLEQTLERGVACGLMRRVGGGYMFAHPLLHDYLAGLAKPG